MIELGELRRSELREPSCERPTCGKRSSPVSRRATGAPSSRRTWRSRRPPTSSSATTSRTKPLSGRSPHQTRRRAQSASRSHSLPSWWTYRQTSSRPAKDAILIAKLDAKIALDPGRKTEFSYPHWKLPFVARPFQTSTIRNDHKAWALPVFLTLSPAPATSLWG